MGAGFYLDATQAPWAAQDATQAPWAAQDATALMQQRATPGNANGQGALFIGLA